MATTSDTLVLNRPATGGLALMVLAAALWATVGVADAAMSGPPLPPAVAGCVRTFLGAMVLGLAALVLRCPVQAPAATRRGFPWPAALAFGLCCALFQVSLFAAFRSIGVSVTVTVTVCLPPLLLALSEAILYRRTPALAVLGAFVLAIIGVLLLKLPPGGGLSAASDPQGIALLLVASFTFCGLTLASRQMTRQTPGLWAAAAGLAMTAVILFAVAVISVPAAFRLLRDLTHGDAILLGYIGITATGLAYLAFACGLARAASASAALVATMTEPAVAALLAAVIIHERLTPPQIAGIAILLIAMFLLNGRTQRDSRSRKSRPKQVAPAPDHPSV